MSFDYLQSAIERFKQYKQLGDKTLEQLDDEQLFWQQNDDSNSIAIIVQHMWGNMLSRWTNFLTEDGEKEWRRRDDEFEKKIETKEELILKWDAGWDCLFNALNTMKTEDLDKTIYIRQEPLIAGDAINRQLTHYAYHVGQIVYAAKLQLGDRWVSLSIPKGSSGDYNAKMKEKFPGSK